MSRGETARRALLIALTVTFGVAVIGAPALARALWAGATTRSELELRVVLASLPIAAVVVLAIVMERAVRRALR